MTTPIGYATLQIIAAMPGITDSINKGLGFLPKAGKDAGKVLADGLAAGVDAAAKKFEQASAKVEAAQKKQADTAGKAKVAEAQLQSLRDKGITDAGRLAVAEEKVAKTKRDHAAVSKTVAGALKAETDASDKLAEAKKRAAKAESDATKSGAGFSGMLTGLKGKIGGTGSVVDGLGAKVKGLGATFASNLGIGVAGGVAGIGASVVAMGETFAQVNKTLAFSTGATGDKLDALNASVRNIGKDSPKSLGDIATAMGEVAKTTQLTGSPLEKLTKQVIKLDTLGQSVDMAGFVQSMRAFGVPADQMSGQLDQIFKVSRAVGAPVSDLIATLGKGAPQLRQFGLNIGESAGLLGGLKMAGVDGDKAMMGLNTALKVVSKQGGDIKANLSKAIADIKGMSDAGNDAGANAAAAKLFGGKAFGPMLAAIKAGKLDIDAMTASLGENQKGILDSGGAVITMSGAWQMFKNNVMILLEPVATKVFATMQKGILWFRSEGTQGIREFGNNLKGIWNSESVQKFVTTISGLFEQYWPKIIEFAINLGREIKDVAQVAGPILVDALNVVVGAIGAVVSAGTGIVNFLRENKELAIALGIALTATVGPALAAAGVAFVAAEAKALAYGVAQTTVAVASKAWAAAQWLLNAALSANPLGLIVTAIAAFVAGVIYAYKHSETFRNIVDAAWKGIKLAAQAVVTWFTETAWPMLKAAWEAIGDGWNWLVETAGKVWTGIREKFTAIVDFITGLPQAISNGANGMWEGLKNGLIEVLRWIADQWNKLTDTLSFDIPEWVPVVGGNKWHLPKIPQFAVGGFTGNLPIKAIAGVVHGGEHVIQAASRQRLETDHPGLLDHMNATGQLPGYEQGGRVPYGLPVGTNTGGYGSSGDVFPPWVHEIEKRFGVKASTYPGHQERDGLNKGIDWVGSIEAMQAFAEFLKGIRGQLEQVIWMNPKTGEKIGVANGQLVGPGTSQPQYYAADWGGHSNHVHTRQSFAFGGTGAGSDALGTPVSSGLGIGGSGVTATANYSGLSGDDRKAKYEGDNEAAKADYDKELAALKDKYGIGADSKELSDRSRDISKRRRDLAAQYRADKDAAKNDPLRLKDLADQYKRATDALKDESDRLAGDRDAAADRKDANRPAFEAAKKELDAKFKRDKDARKSAYDGAKQSGKTATGGGSYPTTVDGWIGFAAEKLIGGQVSSLMSVFGVPEPHWLGAASQFLGGIQVDGKSLLSLGTDAGASSSLPAPVTGPDEFDSGASASVPVAAATPTAPAPAAAPAAPPIDTGSPWGSVDLPDFIDETNLYDSGGWLPEGISLTENRTGGPEAILTKDMWRTAQDGVNVAMAMAKGFAGGAPAAAKAAGPGVVYNIQARDTEDAFIRAQRQERERAAAKLARF